eukprot:UN03708
MSCRSFIARLSLNVIGFRSYRMISAKPFSRIQLHWYTANKRHNTTESSSGTGIGFKSETLYHVEADRAMNIVTEQCDALIQVANDEFDYQTASGVLNINFGANIGVWVLNKQAPNQQLWLSSPVSGPNRYDWNLDLQKWIASRDGHSLSCLLQREFSQTVGSDVSFPEMF